jgi:hypothetical protein
VVLARWGWSGTSLGNLHISPKLSLLLACLRMSQVLPPVVIPKWKGHFGAEWGHETKLLNCTQSCLSISVPIWREKATPRKQFFTAALWLYDSPPRCPSPSLEATHSGLFFILLSLVSQGCAFVPLSCLVQECYLCGGLICCNIPLISPRPSVYCFLIKVKSTPLPQEFTPYLWSSDAFYSTTPRAKKGNILLVI